MAKACRTSLDFSWLTVLFLRELDHFWSSNLAMATETQLAKFGFAPAVHFTFISDCEGVKGTCCNEGYLFAVKKLNVARNRGDLNGI